MAPKPAADQLVQTAIVAVMGLVAAALLMTHPTGALATTPPHKPSHVAAVGPLAPQPATVTTADRGSAKAAP